MSPAAAYRQTGIASRSLENDPHQMIAQLLAGLLERIRLAHTLALRGERARKGDAIRAASAIVDALRLALDPGSGGAIAERLDALYEYVGLRLVEANAGDDAALLDECEGLIRSIADAWAGIGRGAGA
jgi:flagellar protein FliS